MTYYDSGCESLSEPGLETAGSDSYVALSQGVVTAAEPGRVACALPVQQGRRKRKEAPQLRGR